MTIPEHDICRLQACDDDSEHNVFATVTPGHEVWIVAHRLPASGEDGYGEPLDTIQLTQDGWTTLVELYAMRRPGAFARVVAKAQALRDATNKEN